MKIKKLIHLSWVSPLLYSWLGVLPLDAQPVPTSELTRYATVKLTSDLTHLSSNQKKMLGHLIEASKQMDAAFWYQALGDRTGFTFESRLLERHFNINYGPWDRL